MPWFFGLVSRVDLFLSGETGLLEVHASGMNGMYPAFLMAILPSEDGDGNPGVHEDRVDEPVEVDEILGKYLLSRVFTDTDGNLKNAYTDDITDYQVS